MPVTLEQQEPTWLIRLEGEANVACAVALKALLLEWLTEGKNLEVDLERAEEIDISIMQLLWVGSREAASAGVQIVCRASAAVSMALRDAGFDDFSGFPVQP